MAFFQRYYHWRLNFPSKLSISLSSTSVTCSLDCCYYWKFNTKPLYFHHLAVGRVAVVHEEASPNENVKRTNIHHRLLVPRGRLARGSVSKVLWYILAPPQKRSRSGNAKHIRPLSRELALLGRATMPKWSPILGRGLLCCLLNAYDTTWGHKHPTEEYFVYYMRNILDLRRPPKKTLRSLYVFGWCLCQKDLSFYIWKLTELL